MNAPARRPLNSAERDAASQAIPRAAWAAFVAATQSTINGTAPLPEVIAERLWPQDAAVQRILKAATTPAATTDQAFAGLLVQEAAGAFLGSLAPRSAAARLIEAGETFPLGQNGATLAVPYRIGNPATLPWVGEGAPIPARSYNLGEATLGPARKMAAITVLSRELARRAAGEAVLRQLLREDAAASLDAAVFNNLAATAERPAGILNGVAALSPTAGGGIEAIRGDLLKLVGALAAAGGSGEVAIACNPAQAGSLAILAPDLPFEVWPSTGIAVGRIIAVDRLGFVSGLGAEPEVDASAETTVVMDDAPAQIGTAGSPNVVAGNTRSMFQTGQIGVRVILEAAFALRRPGLAQWVEGVTW